jgi:hypothetical protein
VRCRVPLEVELIGSVGAPLARRVRGHLLDEGKIVAGDVAVLRSFLLIHEDDLGTESSHHLRAFFRIAGAHHRDERVTGHRADDREAGAGVPARELHDGLAGHESAARLGVADHAQRDAVLLRPTGVQVLELREDPTVEVTGDPRQLDEWRPPDRIEHRRPDRFSGLDPSVCRHVRLSSVGHHEPLQHRPSNRPCRPWLRSLVRTDQRRYPPRRWTRARPRT